LTLRVNALLLALSVSLELPPPHPASMLPTRLNTKVLAIFVFMFSPRSFDCVQRACRIPGKYIRRLREGHCAQPLADSSWAKGSLQGWAFGCPLPFPFATNRPISPCKRRLLALLIGTAKNLLREFLARPLNLSRQFPDVLFLPPDVFEQPGCRMDSWKHSVKWFY